MRTDRENSEPAPSSALHASTIFLGLVALSGKLPQTCPWRMLYTTSQSLPPLSSAGSIGTPGSFLRSPDRHSPTPGEAPPAPPQEGLDLLTHEPPPRIRGSSKLGHRRSHSRFLGRLATAFLAAPSPSRICRAAVGEGVNKLLPLTQQFVLSSWGSLGKEPRLRRRVLHVTREVVFTELAPCLFNNLPDLTFGVHIATSSLFKISTCRGKLFVLVPRIFPVEVLLSCLLRDNSV